MFLAAVVSAALVFALPACTETEPPPEESSAPDEQTSASGGQTMIELQKETAEAMVGEGGVTVGGFAVESPGIPERSVPEIETSREEVANTSGRRVRS